MKKAVLGAAAVIAAMLAFPVTAVAGQTEEYTYDAASKYVGYGEEATDDEIFLTKYIATSSNATKIKVPEEIEGKTVVGLADNVFYDNLRITEVELPDSVRTLGDSVFNGCENLVRVRFPASLKRIGYSCFSGTGIQELTLPASVESIGFYAFGNCHSLIRADLSNLNLVEEIPYGTFQNDDSLALFKCPPSVKRISDYAFEGCKSLQTIDFSNELESIGYHAFDHCTSLKGICFPETLESIEVGAFEGCTGLKEITLPSGLVSLGYEAFSSCPLSELTFPESLQPENIGNWVVGSEGGYLERLTNNSPYDYPKRIYGDGTWFLDENCSKPADHLPPETTIYRSNAELYAAACRDLLEEMEKENAFADGVDMAEVNTEEEARQYIEQFLPKERKDKVNITIDLFVEPAEAGTERRPAGRSGYISSISITVTNKNSEYGSSKVYFSSISIGIKPTPYNGSGSQNQPGGGSQTNPGNGNNSGSGTGGNGNGGGSNSGSGSSGGSGSHSGSGSSSSSGSNSGSNSSSGGRSGNSNSPSSSSNTGSSSGANNRFTGLGASVHGGEWIEDGRGWWLKTDNGVGYAKNQWAMVNDVWYLFNADGYMATGWADVDGTWYLLNSDGSMQTGWALVSDKWYYLNADGDMATGWALVGDKWYYLNADGDMATGWKQVNEKWYYLDASGAMLANTTTPDGYKVNESGEWIQ